MAKAKVVYRWAPRAAAIIGGMADAGAYRAAQAMRGRAMANIRRLGRIDTGRMINGLQVRKRATGELTPSYEVASTARYTVFQEAGTRDHGPVRATHLVFVPKGGNAVVFAKRVRGVTAGHFMADALRDAKASDAAL